MYTGGSLSTYSSATAQQTSVYIFLSLEPQLAPGPGPCHWNKKVLLGWHPGRYCTGVLLPYIDSPDVRCVGGKTEQTMAGRHHQYAGSNKRWVASIPCAFGATARVSKTTSYSILLLTTTHSLSLSRASPSRAFAASIALTSLVYNLFVAASCAYLPDDPLLIGVSIQYYACAGSVLSALGLVGIATVSTSVVVHMIEYFARLDTSTI